MNIDSTCNCPSDEKFYLASFVNEHPLESSIIALAGAVSLLATTQIVRSGIELTHRTISAPIDLAGSAFRTFMIIPITIVAGLLTAVVVGTLMLLWFELSSVTASFALTQVVVPLGCVL